VLSQARERSDLIGDEGLRGGREPIHHHHDRRALVSSLLARRRVAEPIPDGLGGDDHTVDRLEDPALELPAQGPDDRPGNRPEQALRLGAHSRFGMAQAEPPAPGRIASMHPKVGAKLLAQEVADRGVLAVADRPARVLDAPAEIGVTARPDAVREAAHLLPGSPAHEQVGGDPEGLVAISQMHVLLVVTARHGIASHQPLAAHQREDGSGHLPDVVSDRLPEVAIGDVAHRPAVGIHEQEPVICGGIGGDIASVVRGALAGGGNCPHSVGGSELGEDPLRGVVGDDQLVTVAKLQPGEHLEQLPGLLGSP
jgi:hypothetical protein